MIKKILSSSLAVLLMTSSVGFSYATKEPEFPELIKKNLSSYVFYEDFEKYADYTVTETGIGLDETINRVLELIEKIGG
mgnify:CR=1 FL=1